MGNKNSSNGNVVGSSGSNNRSNTYNSRGGGHALGSSSPANGNPQNASAQVHARNARANLVTTKTRMKNRTELQKKQKIMNIMEQADAVQSGKVPPMTIRDPYQQKQTATTTKINSMSPPKKKTGEPSMYMSQPSSKQAIAAEQRIQAKSRSNKSSSTQERKNRTAQLLFGDGLTADPSIAAAAASGSSSTNSGSNSYEGTPSKPKPKSESSLIRNTSKQASAAMDRMTFQKPKKLSTNQRKQRTLQLMHGGLLSNEAERNVKPRDINANDSSAEHNRNKNGNTNTNTNSSQSTYVDQDIPEEMRNIHQCLLNLQNCNPHLKMPATAKLIRKIITNLLRAETAEDRDKYGKIRLSQKKIKSTIVDMQYGVETLLQIGFQAEKLFNDKTQTMEPYLTYDWGLTHNHKLLWHVIEILDEHYPENL